MKGQYVNWDVRCIPTLIEDSRAQFAKMYPDVSYDDKYILWLKFVLFTTYPCGAVDCKMTVHMEGGVHKEITNLCVRRPYPNKSHYLASMKSGRKVSDAGVILPFDSFEEISKVISVEVYWSMKGLDDPSVGDPYCVRVCYSLSFARAEGKQHYSVYSRDIALGTLQVLCEDKYGPDSPECFAHMMSSLDEYDDVFLLHDGEAEDSIYTAHDIKGNVSWGEALAAWHRAPNAFVPNFYVECFSAAEEIQAHEARWVF